ncbi:ExbD/TolR family protein [Amphritea pacifica]|uniref:Biopolymer transporter ExbD n=1 Tax=Amphritea pacifica TaxID=2811233 RepID=A0ABS2W3S1_9GAMM|nr:biopolymer transporter ExbD [Amphritea pacifica]MBN0986350.1 biopolymer transporter ExbD [Amphritea pacifica]MBN1007043.1 biopolymer transporter ExbD [Amphritea pacifica]
MSYKSPAHSLITLNLTPLIDIVFLLLVFFMLTAHFVDEKQIELTLPEASSAEEVKDAEPVVVMIDAAGTFYINSEVVHGQLLEQRLQRLFSDNPDRLLRVKADSQVSFNRVVKLLDAARLLHINNLEIATREE